MSRGIFRVKPKDMKYVDNVTEFLKMSLGDTYKSDLLLSKYLEEPNKYIFDLEMTSKALVDSIGGLVEKIYQSDEFLALFGYKSGEHSKLGGQAFNKDIAELIKSIYGLVDKVVKKDAEHDIPKIVMDKMKIVNTKQPPI